MLKHFTLGYNCFGCNSAVPNWSFANTKMLLWCMHFRGDKKTIIYFFSAGMATAEEKMTWIFTSKSVLWYWKVHKKLFYKPLDILNLILSTILFLQSFCVAEHLTVSIFLFLWRNTIISYWNGTATMDSHTNGLKWLLFITLLWFILNTSPGKLYFWCFLTIWICLDSLKISMSKLYCETHVKSKDL